LEADVKLLMGDNSNIPEQFVRELLSGLKGCPKCGRIFGHEEGCEIQMTIDRDRDKVNQTMRLCYGENLPRRLFY
jgi:hypothetical protein